MRYFGIEEDIGGDVEKDEAPVKFFGFNHQGVLKVCLRLSIYGLCNSINCLVRL